MATYKIEHTCGHSQEYQLVGKHTERNRKIEWLQCQLCTECKRKAEAEARAKASHEAAESAKEEGLPSLKGSEKQIAWAETIRKDRLDKLQCVEQAFAQAKAQGKTPAGSAKVVEDAFFAIRNMVSAHWWIENREASFFTSARDFQIWLLGGVEAIKGLTPDEVIIRARDYFGGLPKQNKSA